MLLTDSGIQVNLTAAGRAGLLSFDDPAGSDAQVLVKLTKRPQGLQRENLIGVRFVPLLPGKAREL